jgi:hypothetical protein
VSGRKRESASRVGGSEKARRCAALILEVFAGVKGPSEASEAMGVSPNRYYQLEARGLAGLVGALEPLPRGRRRGPDHEIAKLTEERDRLGREVVRLQSLVRAANRSLGIPTGKKKTAKATSRRRKAAHRGKKVVALLRKPAEDGTEGEAKAS